MAYEIWNWDTTPVDKCVSHPSLSCIRFSKLGFLLPFNQRIWMDLFNWQTESFLRIAFLFWVEFVNEKWTRCHRIYDLIITPFSELCVQWISMNNSTFRMNNSTSPNSNQLKSSKLLINSIQFFKACSQVRNEPIYIHNSI